MYELELASGRYKIIYNDNPYIFKALRYGEEWKDLVGDNLTLALIDKIQELEMMIENKYLRR